MADGFVVTIEGRRLACAWFGRQDADAPTLVFLHEGLGSLEQWRDVPGTLARRLGAAALAYSRPGYGRSDAVDEPRPVRFMHDEARVLAQLLEMLDVRRPWFVGHSDGASIALIHAGTGVGPRGPLVLAAPHVFVEDCTVASIARVRQAYDGTDLREKLARYHGANTDSMLRRWTDAWLSPSFRDWNIEDVLASITDPVLVIQGRDDEYGTERQVTAIAAGVRGPCDTLMLAACGHAPHRDRREAFEGATVAFFERYGDHCRPHE